MAQRRRDRVPQPGQFTDANSKTAHLKSNRIPPHTPANIAGPLLRLIRRLDDDPKWGPGYRDGGIGYARQRRKELNNPPVVDWEVLANRQRIPDDLRRFTGVDSNVVRVDAAIDRKQRRKHRETIHLYEGLTDVLQNWEYVRKQLLGESRSSAFERWQVVQFFSNADEGWPLMTVLEKGEDGILSVRTSHRRQKSWGELFVKRKDVVSREGLG